MNTIICKVIPFWITIISIKMAFKFGGEEIRENILLTLLEDWPYRDAGKIRYNVAFHLQPFIVAKFPGYELCAYCNWAKSLNEKHDWCESQMAADPSYSQK